MTESRVIVAVCGLLLGLGVVLAYRWRRCSFVAPPVSEDASAADVLQRYVWLVSLVLLSGIIAGVTIIGAGGRLAMRLLAVTGGDDAQGRLTEAEQVVGEITVDGTLGFFLFIGVLGGLALSAVYFLLRRHLPQGVGGGACYAVLLLAVAGTRIDPLDPGNPDFDIVGPGWLAVLVFTAQALLFGVTLAAVSARLSSWLPLPSRDREALVRYAAPAIAALFAYSVTAALAVIGGLVVLVTRSSALVRATRSSAFLLAGRIALAAIAVVSLPGTITGIAEVART